MLQEHWQAKVSPALSEEAQRNLENNLKSWRKTSYDKKRTKRSVNKTYITPYPEINVMLTTVAIAFICIAIVVLGGYIERKMREARNARHEYQRATAEDLYERFNSIRATMQDFHQIGMGKLEKLENLIPEEAQKGEDLIKEKMELLIKLYQEMLKQNAINSPYPVRLTGGHFNEDFAIIARIIHWNAQWRDDDNVNLIPSSFVICPHHLPVPVTSSEWNKVTRKFYEESGMMLEMPLENDNNEYDEILDINNITKDQLCNTPVCIKPNLSCKGKEAKCHYCNGICCNCNNCIKFRAFFQIRTALINTGKIDKWDYFNIKIEKQVQVTGKMIDHDKQVKKIMKTLYEKAKIDDPTLPMSMDQLSDSSEMALRRKLRHIAVRMMEGPMIKLITGDERLNEMTDELTNEVVEQFLEQQGIIQRRTADLVRWVIKAYHHKKKTTGKEKEKAEDKEKDEEKTAGGSGVTVRFDCNTSSTLQEDESSNSDAEENTITDIGYHVVEDNEKLGESSFDYVYDD